MYVRNPQHHESDPTPNCHTYTGGSIIGMVKVSINREYSLVCLLFACSFLSFVCFIMQWEGDNNKNNVNQAASSVRG